MFFLLLTKLHKFQIIAIALKPRSIFHYSTSRYVCSPFYGWLSGRAKSWVLAIRPPVITLVIKRKYLFDCNFWYDNKEFFEAVIYPLFIYHHRYLHLLTRYPFLI